MFVELVNQDDDEEGDQHRKKAVDHHHHHHPSGAAEILEDRGEAASWMDARKES